MHNEKIIKRLLIRFIYMPFFICDSMLNLNDSVKCH